MIVELGCKIHAESGIRASKLAVRREEIRDITDLLPLLEYEVHYATLTGIAAIRPLHFAGPISCTEHPLASTATVTGMSSTSNS